MKRPILVATIGTIIGIYGGLYLSKNTIPYFLISFIAIFICIIFFPKLLRYLKVFLNLKAIIAFLIIAFLSFAYIKILNLNYYNIPPGELRNTIGEIQSCAKANKYTYSYNISIDGKLYVLYLKKKNDTKEFEYGDIIKLTGKLELPDEARNYGGFNQSNYFKSKNIHGKIYVEKAEIVGQCFSIGKIANNVKTVIEGKIKQNLTKENADILLGILLGDKSKIDDDTVESFKKSSLMHMLCVSRSTCWDYYTIYTKSFWKIREK